MKTDWEVKKLGEVCEVIAGQSPEGKYYNNLGEGLPFYQGKKEFTDKYLGEPTTWTTNVTKEAQKDDVLMSVRAPVGPINFSTQKICIGRGLAAIRASKMIDKDFSFNFLLKHENEIVGNTGAVFNSINKTQIENIKIPFPPLPEQKRIVTILDEAFESITKTKENAEKNLKNAKEIFESYLQSVFENKGEGWEEKKLGEVLQKTETIDPTKNPNKEFIYIDVSSVNNEKLSIENTTLVMGKNAPSRARKLIKTNDIIFATVRPTLKRIAIIPEEFNNQVCSTGYFVLRAKEQINYRLVFYYILTNIFNGQMEKLQKGASYPAVTDSDVRNQIILYPSSFAEQKSIVAKLDAISAETKKLEAVYNKKLADLEELKKSILAKAYEGKLTEASA